MPSDALGEALQLVKPGTETAEGTGRGLILYTGAAEWQQYSPQVEAVRDQFDGIKVQLLTSGPLTLFAQQLPTAKPINLLQGRYTPQTTRAVGWQAWRVAAMLLVVSWCFTLPARARSSSCSRARKRKSTRPSIRRFARRCPARRTQRTRAVGWRASWSRFAQWWQWVAASARRVR